MPIIEFTPTDILASVVLDNGNYTGHFSEIGAAVQSKSGKSTNVYSTFTIDSGKYTGKEFQIAFSSGSNGVSLLGAATWMPMGKLLTIDSIVKGVKQDGTKNRLDTDEIIGISLDVRITQATNSDGVLGNVITDFFPAGSMNKAPSL